MPGPSCPLTVTKCGDGTLRALTASSVLLADPALPLDPAAHDARRDTGDDAAVGDVAAHHRARRHHDVLADPRPGQDDGVGAEPAARADVDRRLGRPLPPDRFDRIEVGVVLVGDVDVRAGLDVVADDDLPVADDVRTAPDDAAAPD